MLLSPLVRIFFGDSHSSFLLSHNFSVLSAEKSTFFTSVRDFLTIFSELVVVLVVLTVLVVLVVQTAAALVLGIELDVVVLLVCEDDTTGVTLGSILSLFDSFVESFLVSFTLVEVVTDGVVTSERGCCDVTLTAEETEATDDTGGKEDGEYDLLDVELLAIILAGEKILFILVGDLSFPLGDADFTGENDLFTEDTAFELEMLLSGI